MTGTEDRDRPKSKLGKLAGAGKEVVQEALGKRCWRCVHWRRPDAKSPKGVCNNPKFMPTADCLPKDGVAVFGQIFPCEQFGCVHFRPRGRAE